MKAHMVLQQVSYFGFNFLRSNLVCGHKKASESFPPDLQTSLACPRALQFEHRAGGFIAACFRTRSISRPLLRMLLSDWTQSLHSPCCGYLAFSSPSIPQQGFNLIIYGSRAPHLYHAGLPISIFLSQMFAFALSTPLCGKQSKPANRIALLSPIFCL